MSHAKPSPNLVREAQLHERAESTAFSYVEREWAQYTADKWNASTQITQGSFVNRHIVTFFGSMLLSQIKPTTIVEFHTAMEAKGLAKKTRRTLHAILATMFSYAVELELMAKSPVKRGVAPKQDKAEKPALREEQFWVLFDKDGLPIRYKAFYMTLRLTGIRTGEALGLKLGRH